MKKSLPPVKKCLLRFIEGREQGTKSGVLKGSQSLANWPCPFFTKNVKKLRKANLLLFFFPFNSSLILHLLKLALNNSTIPHSHGLPFVYDRTGKQPK
jgi:hypothetical protein